MKKSLLIVLVLLISFSNVFSQTVEKIFETEDINLKVHVTNVMPEGIMVDELTDEVYLINGSSGGAWIFNNTDKKVIFDTAIPVANGVVRNQLGKWLISNNDTGVFINSKEIINIANRRGQISSGISFILKKGSGYIVYYVDEKGNPGAVDTEGKIYTSAEAMGYLKEYDSEKYAGSLERAEELGLKTQFLNNEVLAGLSKADLRLLRNTVFALYGYHFNSEDLAAHFDRQVWYTDEGKTTADITLPEHRARLVEMIQALEAEL